ncbi:TMV resistance protein N-like [Dorcoceras hygrometricum]|uniref:TMV resistance protein N-like n=1 Tax=Dorcoceras hygrometricum TaxID=472368 RepID=A0A2Z7CPG2_9LAMI|nr:TMV resistance protein N-like [Dorcoceras hygrometricum]
MREKSYNAPELIQEDLLCVFGFSKRGVELVGDLGIVVSCLSRVLIYIYPSSPERSPNLTSFLDAMREKSYNAPELIQEDLLCVFGFSKRGVELVGDLDEIMGKAELLKAMQEEARASGDVAPPKKATMKRPASYSAEKEAHREKRKKKASSLLSSPAGLLAPADLSSYADHDVVTDDIIIDGPIIFQLKTIHKICFWKFGLQCPTSPLLPPRKAPLEDLIHTICTDPIPQPAAVRTPRTTSPRLFTRNLFNVFLQRLHTQSFTSLFISEASSPVRGKGPERVPPLDYSKDLLVDSPTGVVATRYIFNMAPDRDLQVLERADDIEAVGHFAANITLREALEAKLATEKEARASEKEALSAELEEVKGWAEQEAERLKSEAREEFLKSPDFDALLAKKAWGYFKDGFWGCLAQFRANGYSEEEHPASFLDVQQALAEVGDEEEAEEEEEEQDEEEGG